ncbi:hypothetical protein B0H13DRAFT_1891702 [Mycena leptocephala]|nr:hypothetical protein B0H13DRAFT_1891702 [Mycena leptocephala]
MARYLVKFRDIRDIFPLRTQIPALDPNARRRAWTDPFQCPDQGGHSPVWARFQLVRPTQSQRISSSALKARPMHVEQSTNLHAVMTLVATVGLDVSAAMRLGPYARIVVLGASFTSALDLHVCPDPDRHFDNLVSQSFPAGDSESVVVCIYTGGVTCTYLNGKISLANSTGASVPYYANIGLLGQVVLSNTNGPILPPSLPTDGSPTVSPSGGSISAPSATHSSPSQTSTITLSSSDSSITAPSATHPNSSRTPTGTSSGAGETTTGLLSSPSIDVTSSAANTSMPLVDGGRKSSNHAGKIAGIAVGIAALIITILVGILFCIGWRCRRTRAGLAPASYLESTSSHGHSHPNTTTDPEKQPGGPHFITIGRRSSRAAERRQEFLNNRIRVAQRELDAMNDTVSTSSLDREGDGVPSLEEAKQQIQALQENISVLQRRLQSRWALGVSDEPPPEYME